MNTKTTSEVSQKCDHTKTPWRVLPGDRIYDDRGDMIAKVTGDTDQQSLANAHFICKAVNCHEELLAACKVALGWSQPLIGMNAPAQEARQAVIKQLIAAINRAESL